MGRKSLSGFSPWPYVTKAGEYYYCDMNGIPCYFHHILNNSTRFESHMRKDHPDIYSGETKIKRPGSSTIKKDKNGVRIVESVHELYNYALLPKLHEGATEELAQPPNYPVPTTVRQSEVECFTSSTSTATIELCDASDQECDSPLLKRPRHAPPTRGTFQAARPTNIQSPFVSFAPPSTVEYFMLRLTELCVAKNIDTSDLLTSQHLEDVLSCLRPGVKRLSVAKSKDLVQQLKENMCNQIEARLLACEYVTLLIYVWSSVDAGKSLLIIAARDELSGRTFPWKGRVFDEGNLMPLVTYCSEACLEYIRKCPGQLVGIVADGQQASTELLISLRRSLATQSCPDTSTDKTVVILDSAESKPCCVIFNCFGYRLAGLLIGLLRCDASREEDNGIFADATVLAFHLKRFADCLKSVEIPQLRLTLSKIELISLDPGNPAAAVSCFNLILSHWKEILRLISDIRLDYLHSLTPDIKDLFSIISKLVENEVMLFRVETAVKLLTPLAELTLACTRMSLMESVWEVMYVLDSLVEGIEDADFSGAYEEKVCGFLPNPAKAVEMIEKTRTELVGDHELCGYFLPAKWQADSKWQTDTILKVGRLIEGHGEKLCINPSDVSTEMIEYFRARGDYKVISRASMTPSAYWDIFKGRNSLTQYLFTTAVANVSMATGDGLVADIKTKWNSGIASTKLIDTLHAQWTLQERQRTTGKTIGSYHHGDHSVVSHAFGDWCSLRSVGASDPKPVVISTGIRLTSLVNALSDSESSRVPGVDRDPPKQKDMRDDAESQNYAREKFREDPPTTRYSALPKESVGDCSTDCAMTDAEKGRLANGITHQFFDFFREVACVHFCDNKAFKGCLMINSRKRSGNPEYHVLYDDPDEYGRPSVSHSMTISTLRAAFRTGKLDIPVLSSYIAEMPIRK